jgi:molecular chaperone Hsp33
MGSFTKSAFGDLVQPFQIEAFGLRGRLVRLGGALDAATRNHDYPPTVAALLGEIMALAAVLASGLKYDGVFTLQTQGDGPVAMTVANVTSDGDLRGYARVADGALDAVTETPETPEAPVPRLLGAGHMAFTVDQGADTERYQGITELTGATVTDCARNYFRRSEQMDTAIALAARPGDGAAGARAAALVIQRLPPDVGAEGDQDWRHAVILMNTVTANEMLDAALTPADLLYRLFHREGVRVFRQRRLRHACRCSRERVAATLRSFPRAEVETMAEDGRVTVTCEFCKASYGFDGNDVAGLYAS